MCQRLRKLIGTALLAVFVPFYALTAMSIAGARLPGTTVVVQTLFFAIAGLLWVVPAGLIIPGCSGPSDRLTAALRRQRR